MGDQGTETIVKVNTEAGEAPQINESKIYKADEAAPIMPQVFGLEILNSVQALVFNKPDREVFDPSILYEIATSQGERLFFAFRKSPSKFQPQCDIHILDLEGNTSLRLINPHKHPTKVLVRSVGSPIGTVLRTNWWFSPPKFILRDSNKQEVAILQPTNASCYCLPTWIVCGTGINAFEVLRRRDNEGKKLQKELSIGRLGKDLFYQDQGVISGQMGILFADGEIDVDSKCLLIAAAIFIDYSIFNSSGRKISWKVFSLVALLAIFLIGGVIVFLGIEYASS